MRKEWIFGRMAFCIALLLFLLSPLAMAMDIVYDGRLGDGYGKVLSMEEGLSSFHVRKNSSYVLEIMNQDDVAAVETYDFQARSLMTNRIMPLYWYPHYTVTMVLAVADGIPYEVKDWKDLTVYPLTVGIPVDTVTRDLSMMSFSYGLSGEMDLSAGVEALKRYIRRDVFDWMPAMRLAITCRPAAVRKRMCILFPMWRRGAGFGKAGLSIWYIQRGGPCLSGKDFFPGSPFSSMKSR